MIPQWVVWLWSFVLGSCIGSFLNVCIYRLPRDQSIVRPRSRCLRCEHSIAWYDNLPLISFILLGRRCRHCRAPIAWRYPVIEAAAGIAAVVVIERFGLTVAGLVYTALIWALIAASAIDLEFQIIPDEISLGGLAVGVALSLAFPSLHGTSSHLAGLGRSVIGLLVGGGVLYLTGLLGDFIFRKESMGGGDIKLLAMAGSILGWQPVLLAFFLAPMLALLPGLLVLVFKRTHVIPYGPFLSLGLVVTMFFGRDILQATGIADTLRMLRLYYGW